MEGHWAGSVALAQDAAGEENLLGTVKRWEFRHHPEESWSAEGCWVGLECWVGKGLSRAPYGLGAEG